jgi:hypothetical protein
MARGREAVDDKRQKGAKPTQLLKRPMMLSQPIA